MPTKRIIIAALSLLALSSVARAEAVGYVDTNRVRSTASEPKRMDADFQADRVARNQKINDAVTTAQKAKPAEQNAAWAEASKAQRENNAAIQKHAEEVDAGFLKSLTAILVKLRADRHVTITAGPGAVVVPGADLTDEVIKRWNAADTEGLAAKLAKAEAENAALKAAKPESPKK